MKNYSLKGAVLSLPAPYNLLSGTAFMVGTIFAVAVSDAVAGAEVEAKTHGVYLLPKNASQAWTAGARIYWDSANKCCDTASSVGPLVGAAVYAVAASSTTGAICLGGTIGGAGVAPVPATGISLTGPTAATVGQAATYQAALSPVGGTVASPVTVTPTAVAGVTFSPASLSLTTASPSGTFTATASTSGTKAIAITNSGGLTNPAAVNLVVSAAGAAPAVTSAVAIIGTPTEGVSVSATAGVFTGSPTPTIVREWLVAGIVVATAANYTPGTADAGKVLTVRETATNGVGSPAVSTSAGVTIAAASTAYARFKSSIAAVSGGTGYSRTGLLGDSTTAGARALGPAANAVRTESPVVYLKTRLNAVQALPAIATSWIGDQSFGITNTLSPYNYDARFSQPDGAGFTYSQPTPRTVAGSMMFNSVNSNRLGFLPEAPVDTSDIYYAVNTTLGTFDVTRVGSTLVNVNQAGTSGTGKYTFSGTLSGTNPLYIARNTGGAYIIGVDSYNSAIKSIRLLGMGWSGGKVVDWITTANGFDPLPALVALNLDLVLIRPGINDASANTVPATYKSQLGTLVDALLAAGTNVAMATHYPSNTTVSSLASQDAIAQATREVATERGLSIRDTYAEWGSWTAANALGYMADNLHPYKAGYEAEAVGCATFILGLAA